MVQLLFIIALQIFVYKAYKNKFLSGFPTGPEDYFGRFEVLIKYKGYLPVGK